jgi:transcription-repair coupling factor (superfamily II helicase)
MELTRPMDRLICGDVGFGKTEVAIRAAFKAVQGGRQVAVLVPTTVLAQQHLNTFRERMAGYPDRGRDGQPLPFARGAEDPGRHRGGTGRHPHRHPPPPASDVAFRDLGLVVIDEEQRFGVKHKERFKAMRATVDVLSMSATPDPAHALHGADRRPRSERHRDRAHQPPSHPDHRPHLRREDRGRRRAP